MPGAEDRCDYFMMRRKRAAYYLVNEEEDNSESKDMDFVGIDMGMREDKGKKLQRLATSIAKVTNTEIRESIACQRNLRSSTYVTLKKPKAEGEK